MNVYDFDKTIYDGDSSIDFFKFLISRYPWQALRIIPFGIAMIIYKLGLLDKAKAKSFWYRALKDVDSPKEEIELFWDKNIHKIKDFYQRQRKDDDIISSASPDFLIGEAMKRLKIDNWIASPVSLEGKPLGINNDGFNKIIYFQERYPDAVIDEFYSDSLHDRYLAKMAKQSFLVTGNRIEPWPKDKL